MTSYSIIRELDYGNQDHDQKDHEDQFPGQVPESSDQVGQDQGHVRRRYVPGRHCSGLGDQVPTRPQRPGHDPQTGLDLPTTKKGPSGLFLFSPGGLVLYKEVLWPSRAALVPAQGQNISDQSIGPSFSFSPFLLSFYWT